MRGVSLLAEFFCYHLIAYASDVYSFGEDDPQRLGRAGLLHDIGKKDTKYWSEPRTLTPEEFEEIKKHPSLGWSLAIKHQIEEDKDILDAILLHQEMWDGKGYPAGMKGEEIPLFARIIALCDAFDAMVSGRVYKGYKSFISALIEIGLKKGTQFDPVLADYFINYVEKELMRIIFPPE